MTDEHFASGCHFFSFNQVVDFHVLKYPTSAVNKRFDGHEWVKQLKRFRLHDAVNGRDDALRHGSCHGSSYSADAWR